MKKNIILALGIAAACTIAGSVSISSVANNCSEKWHIGMGTSSANVSPSGTTDSFSSGNGEGGAGMNTTITGCHTSITPDSFEHIAQTKEFMILALDDHYEVFMQIVSHSENHADRYRINKTKHGVELWVFRDGVPGYQVSDLHELDIADSIEFVLNILGFSNIYIGRDRVMFEMPYGTHPHGGTYSQCLYWYSENTDERNLQVWSGAGMEKIRLRETWFYELGIGNA